MCAYYDGAKLLSMMDISGKKPELYLCTTNRTAGKTTYFSRLCVNRFLKYGEKFCLVYRYNYEMDDCADKFYKDIKSLFFPGTEMISKRRARGCYHELFIDEKPCGYAISLNGAEQLKRYSHLLSDVDRMFFDEFQSETNHYCPGEIRKFISVHTSIARGQGEQARYVPVYLCGNTVSILNPYYVQLGISGRLRDDTRFLRGDGFVLEQGFVESAAKSQLSSGFNRAFAGSEYVAYSAQCVYLNDNKAFISTPTGKSHYLATLKYEGTEYGIREYPEQGIIYCNAKPDNSFPHKICVTTDDHEVNYVMLKSNSIFIASLRYYFDHGCFRFSDLKSKQALLAAISY